MTNSSATAATLTMKPKGSYMFGGTFDGKLDEEPTGLELKDGTPISFVLKLGYYFPDSTLAPHPVKSIVLA